MLTISSHKKARAWRAVSLLRLSSKRYARIVIHHAALRLLPTVERGTLLLHALRLLRRLLPALVVTVEHGHVAQNRPLDALLSLLLRHVLRHHAVVAVLAFLVQVDEAGRVEIDTLLTLEQPRLIDLRHVDFQPYAYLAHAVASSGCVAGP